MTRGGQSEWSTYGFAPPSHVVVDTFSIVLPRSNSKYDRLRFYTRRIAAEAVNIVVESTTTECGASAVESGLRRMKPDDLPKILDEKGRSLVPGDNLQLLGLSD